MNTPMLAGSLSVDELVAQVVEMCLWLESDQGRYVMLHMGTKMGCGEVAEGKMVGYSNTLCNLFDSCPEGEIVIELSRDQFYPTAIAETDCSVIWIEKHRRLPPNSLRDRLMLVDATSWGGDVHQARLEQRRMAQLNQSVPPLNPIELALARAGL